MDIFTAIENNDLEFIKNLVKDGVDIEAKNIYGNTPLMWAVCEDNLEIIKFLIEQGANPKAINNEGEKAIDIARIGNYIEIIKYLEPLSKPFLKSAKK